MKYSIEKEDNYAVFTLQEENLNTLIAPKLKSEFIFLQNEGVKNLILDMTDVKYVDSSGLSAMLTANRLWSNNGSFIVAGKLNDTVKKIIEISRLDTIITFIPTVDESIDYVMMEEIERNLRDEMEEE
jgi:anti-anti-sigma factor